jgi:hypothetical protein
MNRILLKLGDLAGKHNFKLIVVPVHTKQSKNGSLEALRGNVNRETLAALDIAKTPDRVSKLLSEENIQYEQLFWKYDGHLNVLGNKLFGIAVARTLAARFQN